ncbi:unnamed protein product [Strongylus vulgaris]|uniref:Uncharacterized protein n=1 Tax=Strongylus vulgaris TaxID=40348 RepID=A0A3P7LLP8_STRVU|nr:unnamed protein product [Strongylus vulgaris]
MCVFSHSITRNEACDIKANVPASCLFIRFCNG